ncbi:hypothetical protein GCM10022232_87660 [Streptomyces plumbiresistens]|uniref:Uncharacterized protein n=1 Tax=Streptomyces plumbiresistens TaxID=511811 RepID=A0ABP7TM14_9ACTN
MNSGASPPDSSGGDALRDSGTAQAQFCDAGSQMPPVSTEVSTEPCKQQVGKGSVSRRQVEHALERHHPPLDIQFQRDADCACP